MSARGAIAAMVMVGLSGCDAVDGGGGDVASVQIDLENGAMCMATETMTTLSIEVRMEGADADGVCTIGSRCIERPLTTGQVELTVDLLEDVLRGSAPLLNLPADGASRIVVSTFNLQGCDDFFTTACGSGALDGVDGEVINVAMDCSATAECSAPPSCD